jgi:hypothetical protein
MVRAPSAGSLFGGVPCSPCLSCAFRRRPELAPLQTRTAPPLRACRFPGFVDNLPSLSGRVVAITGCTTGTGYACAKGCLAKGARVRGAHVECEGVTAPFSAL